MTPSPDFPSRPFLNLKKWISWIAILAGLAYGLSFRLMAVNSKAINGHLSMGSLFEVMSKAFLFAVPFGIGFLQVYLSEAYEQRSWLERLFGPWAPVSLCLVAAMLLAWEGIICLVMCAPILLIVSSIGGLTAAVVREILSGRSRQFMVAWCLALPILIAPVENRQAPSRQIRTVATEISIAAAPATIWRQIKSVPAIRPEELTVTWTQRMGFPRPVAATLSAEGVGGVRKASFEKGVVFWETVSCWEPNRKLTFSIRADTASIPLTTLDEHVKVGGPYFDVLQGEYRIEQIGPREVILHLSSQHRLSTRFNVYAGLWTDAVMQDLQQNILQVIKKRCETGSAAQVPSTVS